jgi:hypothetical protein
LVWVLLIVYRHAQYEQYKVRLSANCAVCCTMKGIERCVWHEAVRWRWVMERWSEAGEIGYGDWTWIWQHCTLNVFLYVKKYKHGDDANYEVITYKFSAYSNYRYSEVLHKTKQHTNTYVALYVSGQREHYLRVLFVTACQFHNSKKQQQMHYIIKYCLISPTYLSALVESSSGC